MLTVLPRKLYSVCTVFPPFKNWKRLHGHLFLLGTGTCWTLRKNWPEVLDHHVWKGKIVLWLEDWIQETWLQIPLGYRSTLGLHSEFFGTQILLSHSFAMGFNFMWLSMHNFKLSYICRQYTQIYVSPNILEENFNLLCFHHIHQNAKHKFLYFLHPWKDEE